MRGNETLSSDSRCDLRDNYFKILTLKFKQSLAELYLAGKKLIFSSFSFSCGSLMWGLATQMGLLPILWPPTKYLNQKQYLQKKWNKWYICLKYLDQIQYLIHKQYLQKIFEPNITFAENTWTRTIFKGNIWTKTILEENSWIKFNIGRKYFDENNIWWKYFHQKPYLQKIFEPNTILSENIWNKN